MKAIKYIISLGFIVVGAIIVAICAPHVESLSELSFVFGEGERSDFNVEITAEQSDSIKLVSIDADVAKVKLVKGDAVTVTCENIVKDNFDCEIKNGELEIEYDQGGFFGFSFGSTDCEITVTLPEKVYEEITVEQGVGKFTATDISCNVFKLECGVGDSNLVNVTAKSLDVDMGVGECEIRDAVLTNCKIEGGVGDFTINNSDILSGCSIDGGVGEININLNSDNYKVIADSGVGDVVFNGDEVNNSMGSGEVTIDADCGVGDININTGLKVN